MKLVAYTDGGSDGQGQAYVGVVLLDENGEVVREIAEAIGEGTNNEAEYSGVIMAIYAAIEEGAHEIQIYCDSRLVVNQVNRVWAVHKNHIKEYFDEIIRLNKYIDIKVDWIPRTENKMADKLSRLCR